MTHNIATGNRILTLALHIARESTGITQPLPLGKSKPSAAVNAACVYTLHCKRCGEPFIPDGAPSPVMSHEYCSPDCIELTAAGYAEPYGTCEVCGNGLSRAVAKAGLKYCSDICRERRFDRLLKLPKAS